jgi:carboxylate-amine ligase
VGIELELQILDRDTGDLSPGAVRLLAACAEEGLPGVSAEFLQSQLEVKTGICRDAAEARDQLLAVLRRLRNVAGSLGFDLGMGGTHPFTRSSAAAVFPDERYLRIQNQLAWLTNQGLVFGLHVHVGVRSGDLAIGMINGLVQYLPHLLALSASSPFWEGVDTGLASSRAALNRLVPHGGLPHYFRDWQAFAAYCRLMYDCRAIEATKDLYWDIRPRPRLGTVEFRICDMPLTLTRVLVLAALIRNLVVATERVLEECARMRRGDLRHYWVAAENKWLATRYGLEAECIRTPGRKRLTLAADIARLLDELQPVARGTGDADFLNALRAEDPLQAGAERQRRVYRETGDWRRVIDEMRLARSAELEEARGAITNATPR